jgi:hypothetical protein
MELQWKEDRKTAHRLRRVAASRVLADRLMLISDRGPVDDVSMDPA